MFRKLYIRYFFWLISLIIAISLLHGCGGARSAKKSSESKKVKIAKKKDKEKIKKEKALEKKGNEEKKKKNKIAKKEEPEKKEITIGKTTKAYLIANYGKPDKLFWSKEAEEILIYDSIKEIGKNVIIFMNNKGVVKHITTFSKK